MVTERPFLKTVLNEKINSGGFDNELNKWNAYLNDPGGKAWYQAHNSTIVTGYQGYIELAKAEIPAEQHFLNEVLYRLLFAQSLEEGATFLKHLGTMLANPMLPAVDIITAIPAMYPRHYPLSSEDIKNVEHKGSRIGSALEDILDTIILSNIKDMYQEAEGWNGTEELQYYLNDKDQPSYPTDAYLNEIKSKRHERINAY